MLFLSHLSLSCLPEEHQFPLFAHKWSPHNLPSKLFFLLPGGNTLYLCKFVQAGQEFPVFMSSFCIGAIACDRFRFIVQAHRKQMTANQVKEIYVKCTPLCLLPRYT